MVEMRGIEPLSGKGKPKKTTGLVADQSSPVEVRRRRDELCSGSTHSPRWNRTMRSAE